MSEPLRFPPSPPAVPQFCPKLKPRREGYLQVYGYLVDREFLYKYGLEHKVTSSELSHNIILRALVHILDQCDLIRTRTIGAKVEGGTCNIVALATNATRESMILPPQYKIDKLRELFGLEEGTEPQWYKRA